MACCDSFLSSHGEKHHDPKSSWDLGSVKLVRVSYGRAPVEQAS